MKEYNSKQSKLMDHLLSYGLRTNFISKDSLATVA